MMIKTAVQKMALSGVLCEGQDMERLLIKFIRYTFGKTDEAD